ncbi:hypothetical protein HDV63DRAFT_259796 [Trichoderma sp. SZMC 28014]
MLFYFCLAACYTTLLILSLKFSCDQCFFYFCLAACYTTPHLAEPSPGPKKSLLNCTKLSSDIMSFSSSSRQIHAVVIVYKHHKKGNR